MAANENPTTTVTEMPALFADFDVTLQDVGERPIRALSDIPKETVALMQWLYDTGQKGTFSFKGGKLYFGKSGESAAKQFVNDSKDSAPHLTARPEHPNGLSVTANADGIVVSVSVGKKRGRTPNDKTESKSE